MAENSERKESANTAAGKGAGGKDAAGNKDTTGKDVAGKETPNKDTANKGAANATATNATNTANAANANQDTAVKGKPPREKVGDLLRKERLTRRITIETIAKDLKLNVGYVKALEASDYDSLPPDPYIRVYIRSLTKYLSLDAEVILKEFYKERGLIADDSVQTQQGNKIEVKVERQDKNPAVIFIAALIVIMAVFAFIANKKGWISQPEETTTTIEEKPDTGLSAIDHDALSKKIADSILDATLAGQRQESEPPPVTKSKSMSPGATKSTPPPPRP
jgi:cytoskeletal protein RodZ